MRILILTARPPWPPRRGDQARTAGFTAQLARSHQVRVVALRPPGFPECPWPEIAAGIEVPVTWTGMLRGVATNPRLPIQVGLHRHGVLSRVVREQVERFVPDAAIVVLSRLGPALPALAGVPTLLDFVDSLSLNMYARARRQRLAAPLLRWEGNRLARWDLALLGRADHGAVVSSRDRDAIAGGDDQAARRISVLPFGLPVPAELPRRNPPEEVVLLSGNLGYFPTVDAAVWFSQTVWPLVHRRRPNAQWWLVGARPARAIRRLACLPGVRIVANPPDLEPFRAAAAVAVAPLRSGSGTPIKVLEAMAAGIPLVATSAAVAGLDDLPPDGCPIADEPVRFAELVTEALEHRSTPSAQLEAAWHWVSQRHGLEPVARNLETLLHHLVAGRATESSLAGSVVQPDQRPPVAP